MIMVQHPEFSVFIAYHRDELKSQDAEFVENHISVCKPCRILFNDALLEANQPDFDPLDKPAPVSFLEKASRLPPIKSFVSRRNKPNPSEIWSACNNLVYVHPIQSYPERRENGEDFFNASTVSHLIEYATEYDLLLPAKESGIPYDIIIQLWNTYTIPVSAFEDFRYQLKRKHVQYAQILYNEFLNPGSQNLAGIKRGKPITDSNDPRNQFIEQCILDASEIKEEIFTALNPTPEHTRSEEFTFDYTQAIREWFGRMFVPTYSLTAAAAREERTIPRFMYIKKDRYIEVALEYSKETGTVNILLSAKKNIDYRLMRRQKGKSRWLTLKPNDIFNKTAYFEIGKRADALEKYEYLLKYTKKTKDGSDGPKEYSIKF